MTLPPWAAHPDHQKAFRLSCCKTLPHQLSPLFCWRLAMRERFLWSSHCCRVPRSENSMWHYMKIPLLERVGVLFSPLSDKSNAHLKLKRLISSCIHDVTNLRSRNETDWGERRAAMFIWNKLIQWLGRPWKETHIAALSNISRQAATQGPVVRRWITVRKGRTLWEHAAQTGIKLIRWFHLLSTFLSFISLTV